MSTMTTEPLPQDGRLPVVLLWHLHQPEYRVNGQFRLPWACLHAIGAYSDMAAHLEEVGGARAVVNFSPVLIDQLEDYAGRLQRHLLDGTPIGDPIVDALHALPPVGPSRADIVRLCLPVQRNSRTDRVGRYASCAETIALGGDWSQVSDELLTELVMGFHLSWLGESVRQRDSGALALLQHEGPYTAALQRQLLELIATLVGQVIPRYRALADSGRVELSMTPYYHPLLPLLLDFSSARDTAPDAGLPEEPYPGGEDRARWHLEEGLRRFERSFGRRPVGCWPSEGAVSDATLNLLNESGFRWTATGQSVLNATFQRSGQTGASPFRAYRPLGSNTLCFFRDDALSDRIGFVYKDWAPEDAVANLTHHLTQIADLPQCDLVLLALDGENPWEWYRDAGWHFVRNLYATLVNHPRLRAATLQDLVPFHPERAVALPPLRAGSWVHGQLLTWIGHPEKNRAWQLLIDAKHRYDVSPRAPAALRELAACEGSDWFWWPGAYNPAPAVADFDALFRAHLAALYDALGETPPGSLAEPFAIGVHEPVAAGGTMRAST